MHPGERVLISWAAANLDENVFPDPLKIDIDRDTRKHAAFGLGLHRCIGRHIAQIDFEVVVGAVLARLSDYTLVENAEVRYRDIVKTCGFTGRRRPRPGCGAG